MTRKIEFRVWDKSCNYFLTSRGSEYEESPNYFYNGGIFYNLSEILSYHLRSNNDGGYGRFAIQQFTGLKDKNGEKIYEGDVVKCWKSDCHYLEDGEFVIGEVKWDEDYAGFYVVYKGKVDDDLVPNTDCEVIGNIFENLDLL